MRPLRRSSCGWYHSAELVALDREAQLALEAHARERRDVHALLEIDVASAAAFLRAIHRGVGVAQELLGRRAVRGVERDADAGVEKLFGAGDDERRGHRLDDVLGDGFRVPRRLDVRQDDREFVAAEPRHGIGLAHALPQAFRRLPQHIVARFVSQACR